MVEKIYNIPLRREWLKAPKWRRSKKAISAIKLYLKKHTKVPNIKLSKWINEKIWARGGKKPPSKITVKVEIDKEKEIAKAELAELPEAAKRLAEKKKKQEEKAKKVEAKKPKPETLREETAKETAEKEKEEKTPAAMSQKQEMALHKK
ncbi:MAG: 50S ribosomal protein L31e [Candidatus Nanoarchaeia archaeon]